MKQNSILKDYYKSLERAPFSALKEFEEIVLAVINGFKAVNDKKSVKVYQKDLEKIRKMMRKTGQNQLNK